jgi:hypothetical protein
MTRAGVYLLDDQEDDTRVTRLQIIENLGTFWCVLCR